MSIEPQAAIFWDRTRRERDQKCARSRWHSFEAGGRGYSLRRQSPHLALGIALHGGIEGILRGDRGAVQEALFVYSCYLDSVWADHANKDAIIRERMGLLNGFLIGFERLVLPNLLLEYELVLVESSQVLDHNGIRYGFKPDVILRRRADGTLWYIDWKSTAKVDRKWLASWHKAIQLHLAAYAYEQVLGERIEGVIVQGFLKGRLDDDQLSSPLLNGWHKPADPPLLPALYAATRPKEWKGWKAINCWDMGGQEAWFDLLGDQLLSQFPRTEPIFLEREIVESTLRQAAWREKEIAAAKSVLLGDSSEEVKQSLLERVFPQNFGQCEPAWGEPCDYCHLCWSPEIAEDPEGSGLFVPREPHHSTEYVE